MASAHHGHEDKDPFLSCQHPTPNNQHPALNLKAMAAQGALDAKSAMEALQIKWIL
jgi:hypothetical protein